MGATSCGADFRENRPSSGGFERAKNVAPCSSAGETRGLLQSMKASLGHFATYRGLRFAWHLAMNPGFRADQLMRMRRPGNLFQYRSVTFPNRYPRIFAFVREQLAGTAEPQLLSFGCATGEEVFSLREYLPSAVIKGVDINAHNIAVCRAKLAGSHDAKIAFAQQDSAAGEPPEHYDAVFCLAVFQHKSLQESAVQSCEGYLSFAAFDQVLAGLARSLRPGGYLAIRHAHFRFADASCSANFAPVMRIEPVGLPHARFDPRHRRLPDGHDENVVFRKLRGG